MCVCSRFLTIHQKIGSKADLYIFGACANSCDGISHRLNSREVDLECSRGCFYVWLLCLRGCVCVYACVWVRVIRLAAGLSPKIRIACVLNKLEDRANAVVDLKW